MHLKTSNKFILQSDFMGKNGVFSNFYVSKYGKPPVCGLVFYILALTQAI
jgi:hypothetical protein